MTEAHNRPLTPDEALEVVSAEPSADVQAWQDAKVRAAIKAADAGKFANNKDLRRVIRKYVPDG